ncbi:MAG: D-alanyl-D-alanine carboxypeptidase [Alphaproteobacteria bacterium]
MRSHLLVLACALLLLPAQALGGPKEKVAALAPSGVVLVMDEQGNELIAQNADKPFVPASVAKIVTAWLAMEVLGSDYRFETRFYLDAKRVLTIRGGGDPFLVSEELAELAPALVAAIGREPLTGIVLDASYYPSDIRIPGIEDTGEAYDALNSALAVNFNTINAVRKGKAVASAEPQTPITPLAISQFRARGPQGRGRISLTQQPRGRPAICRRTDRRIHRAGRRQPQRQDLDRSRPEGPRAGLRSPPVAHAFEILAELLVGSNNYVANQVFLEVGGHRLRRAGEPREIAQGCKRDACQERPRRGDPSGGRLGHQPRQPLHGARPCRGAAPVRAQRPICSGAARAPASRPARFRASARSRALPTPPRTGACAS